MPRGEGADRPRSRSRTPASPPTTPSRWIYHSSRLAWARKACRRRPVVDTALAKPPHGLRHTPHGPSRRLRLSDHSSKRLRVHLSASERSSERLSTLFPGPLDSTRRLERAP
eukprot:1180447-Prorocentrum_minimum.AAC.1